MLHLVQSNKLEVLTEQLAEVVSQHPPESIFTPTTILVQSPGMAQWLKLQLAEKLGIAANLAFPLPSSYIWDLYRQHIDDLPSESAFTKANMTWKLMTIVPVLLEQSEFISIRDYLSVDDQGIHQLKLYQLCLKIADIFDQYLVYRPDWISAWEANQALTDVDVISQPWQPLLWRALVEYSLQLQESPWHRANLHQALLQVIKDTDMRLPPVYAFGISALPRQQLEILSALATHTQVYIFWCNPSLHFWADLVDAKTLAKQAALNAEHSYLFSGNPLLSSWGKLGRDYQDMLLALEPQQHDCFVEIDADSLLTHIQQEVLQLTHRGSMDPLSPEELNSNGQVYPKMALAADDNSVRVHVCHSPLRELEILHDQLLHMFNQDAKLQPADIIVMLPDVATYAPLIDGVFGSVDGSLRIPFAIADRNIGDESSIIRSFVQLMRLHQSRLILSDVLCILEVPAVQKAFDISADEFDKIAIWLADAGVRWGADGPDKEHFEVPEQGQNSWRFGLDRLLAGYAMQAPLWQGQTNIAPYADIEGQQAEALGKFYLFFQRLLDIQGRCRTSLDLTQRTEFALDVLEDMYQVEEQEMVHVNSLREAISALSGHQTQFTQAVTQDVFVTELEQSIQEKGVGQKFLAGYVNFCTLMPMRSIPFKVVCLLGMNDADYPRQVMPVGFDLMRIAKPRKGDRSRRQDDRYLFLEAILSARQNLYLSYVGLSQRDNSALSPSILLSELLEYCQQSFCLQGQHQVPVQQAQQNLLAQLITEHKLQPFDAFYYAQDTSVSSFNAQWPQVIRQAGSVPQKIVRVAQQCGDTAAACESQQVIQLADLIQFFMNPAKQFIQQRWHTSLTIYAEQVEQSEPFSLDGLGSYQIKQRMLKSTFQQVDTDWRVQLASEGQLPVGHQGEWWKDKLAKQIGQQADAIQPFLLTQPQTVEINLALPDIKVQLQGWLDNLYSDTLLFWRPGKLRAKDMIGCWLNWLALCATDGARAKQACFVANDKRIAYSSLLPDDAKQALSAFVRALQTGLETPLCFFPETAWTWISSQDKTKTLSAFSGNAFVTGEGQEPHIYRLFPDLSDDFAAFQQVSEALLTPMAEAMQS